MQCHKDVLKKVFAGSGSLQYRVALVAGQYTQGATQYKKDVYKQCGMEMSQQLQESFWRQKEERRNDETTMQPTKTNSNGKGNETKNTYRTI